MTKKFSNFKKFQKFIIFFEFSNSDLGFGNYTENNGTDKKIEKLKKLKNFPKICKF